MFDDPFGQYCLSVKVFLILGQPSGLHKLPPLNLNPFLRLEITFFLITFSYVISLILFLTFV